MATESTILSEHPTIGSAFAELDRLTAQTRTTQVLTKSGAVRSGLVVYESVDGLMLQMSPSEMVRIPSEEIEEKRLQRTSIMPTGLLKDASDGDLADLGAYLKGLK